jgi:hypothetical protein
MSTNPEQQEQHQHTVHIKINCAEHKTHAGKNPVDICANWAGFQETKY